MIKTKVLKHLPGAGKGERGWSKGNVRGGATAKGAIEKSRYCASGSLRGRRSEEMTEFEYFLPTEVGSTFRVPEGVMAIQVPRMKRFLEEGRMDGEKESILPSVGEEQIGGA